MLLQDRNASPVTSVPYPRFTYRAVLLLVMLLAITGLAFHDLTRVSSEPRTAPTAVFSAAFEPSLPRADQAFPLAVAPPVRPHVWQTVVALVTAYTPGV